LGKINWQHTFYRPEINFKLGSKEIKKDEYRYQSERVTEVRG
jgi:hypothetical protein